jgi:hypothetical protein
MHIGHALLHHPDVGLRLFQVNHHLVGLAFEHSAKKNYQHERYRNRQRAHHKPHRFCQQGFQAPVKHVSS